MVIAVAVDEVAVVAAAMVVVVVVAVVVVLTVVTATSALSSIQTALGVNSVSLKRARKKARKGAPNGFLKRGQLLEVPNILVQKMARKRTPKCTRKRARDGK